MSAAPDAAELIFFPGFDALPKTARRLWAHAQAPSFFLTPAWFECLIAAGLDPGDRIALGTLQSKDGQLLGMLPARFADRRSSPPRGATLRSLTGPYACIFRPVLASGLDPTQTARTLGQHLGASIARGDIIHFDALDEDWPELRALEAGLRVSGFLTARYDHFGNWSEPVGGRSFEQYLAAREGSLREIVRRRRKILEKQGARYVVFSGGEGIESAVASYEAIYARSWKQPEPYPRFHEHLIRIAAREGALRLGFCQLGDRPIAVQLWIQWNRSATVLKLAHDREFDRLSPGTILLAHMIRHAIETDGAEEIDFGRGDDAYKRQWATRRRQRIGLIAANPRSIVGLGVLARQLAGRWVSSIRRQGSRRSGGHAIDAC